MSNKDIILDEQAFESADARFQQLAIDVKNLNGELKEALDSLETGFDTPAGRRFIAACESNLLSQLDKQEKVVLEISKTLTNVKQKYSKVFEEYENLNKNLCNYKH